MTFPYSEVTDDHLISENAQLFRNPTKVAAGAARDGSGTRRKAFANL